MQCHLRWSTPEQNWGSMHHWSQLRCIYPMACRAFIWWVCQRPQLKKAKTGSAALSLIRTLISPHGASPSTWHLPNCPKKAAVLILPLPSLFLRPRDRCHESSLISMNLLASWLSPVTLEVSMQFCPQLLAAYIRASNLLSAATMLKKHPWSRDSKFSHVPTC